MSNPEVAAVAAQLRDKSANSDLRVRAVYEAIEILKPETLDDHSRTADDQLLIDALTALACDANEPSGLLDRAGYALALTWLWGDEFDDATFAKMAPAAQYGAKSA